MKRVFLAFLIAPIAPFLIYIITGPLVVFIIMVGAPIAYAAALVGGIPSFLILKHYPQYQDAKTYTLLGAIIGFVAGTLLLNFSNDETTWKQSYLIGCWTMLHGACSGYIFWRIMRSIVRANFSDLKKVLSHAKTY